MGHSLSLVSGQMVPLGTAVDFIRARHPSLSTALRVATAKLSVTALMPSLQDVIGLPLPLRPSTAP